MKVIDLVPKAPVDELIITVVEKGEVRDVKGGMLKLCECLAKDDSGTIKLALWNKDIDAVKVGDKIKITKGWVNEYQGELSVSSGKFGKMEILASGNASSVPQEVQEAYDEDII